MSGQKTSRSRVAAFVYENSLFLILGSVVALVWANVAPEQYERVINTDLLTGEYTPAVTSADADSDNTSTTSAATDEEATAEPGEHEHHHPISLYFIINDLLMAFFFAIAGSEVWEALLPGGALSNPRKAATPLLATLGGIIGPAGLYVAGCLLLNRADITNGWAIPCATDIAFSYLVARFIFGPGHPAIAFLLLLAIADDAAGLIIIAVFYPSGPLHLAWLLASVAGVVIGFIFRKLKLQNFWWYLLIPGTLSWVGFLMSGIHPALGLVPIIITMPHAHTDLGIFAREEMHQDDTLNQFTKWWANPVEIILGLFGLVNAGVLFSSVGDATWLVLAGLLIGKPVGITLLTWIAQKLFRLEIPGGMNYRDVMTLGMIAGIGFTVALFVSGAAFKAPDPNLDSAKMGALASFGAAALAIAMGKLLKIQRYVPPETPDQPASDSESQTSPTEA